MVGWPAERVAMRSAGDGSGGFAALEALAAENGPSLGGAERDRCFAAALGANGRGFYSSGRSASLSAIGRARLALRLTGPAALRLVPELFFVVKLLLARGENEVRTAVDALENPILKFGHGTILEWKDEADAIRCVC